MEKLPKFTKELIHELDKAVPYVEFPATLDGVEELSDRKVRRLAFLAGQRALIDDLLSLTLQDEQDGDRDSDGDYSSGGSGWGDILGGPTG
jgi:hypothetical protein